MKAPVALMSIALGGLVVLAGSRGAFASVAYSGGNYVQNFNTLPVAPENASLEAAGTMKVWKDDTDPVANPTTIGVDGDAASTYNVVSIPGWYLRHNLPLAEGGFNGNQRLRVSHGQATTGSFYSYGSTDSTDRALGELGSTTVASNPPANQDVLIALRLTNNSGDTYTQFTLNYTGEQWRDNGNANTDSMVFAYSLDAAATINSGTYVGVTDLDFVSPIHSTTATQLDGNADANRLVKSATITGISWAPGTDLWLRWNGLQISGNDHSLGIDDVDFSATVPDPASIALLLLGVPAALRRRR